MSKITEKPNIKQIQEKLIEKLQPTGWANFLKGYLKSSDFELLIEFLVNENQEGRRFTPALKQIFRAFEECSLDNTKVVIIGQDPYPQPTVADGIAFSCSNTNKPEVSLRYIMGAIEDTVSFEERDVLNEETQFDLVRWSRQGVLVLNSALTTEVGKTSKHVEQWKPFMNYLIDMLNFQRSGLVWALMGKQAQSFDSLIGEHHTILKCTHPAYASYMKVSKWDCNNVFNKVNAQLAEYKKDKILW